MKPTTNYQQILKPLITAAISSAAVLVLAVAALAQGSTASLDSTSNMTGRDSPRAAMAAWINQNPDAAYFTADKSFPQGGVDLSKPDGFGNIGMSSGSVWPELAVPTAVMGGQHLGARFKVMNNITGFQNAAVGKYPLTTNMAAIISATDAQLQAAAEASPQNAMERSKTEQDEANANTADTNANLTRFNAGSAIDYTGTYIENFTVQDDNLWNTVRNEIFIPMAILILLPGAVLSQVKAIVSAGSPVVGANEVLTPFDGIMRSIVAIFLIPATYLFINYGIDLANSLTFTISDQYQQIFGSSMYQDAMCMEVRAFPVRNVSENLSYIPNQTSQMGMLGNSPGSMGGGPTPLAKFEGTNLEVKLEDPCAGIYVDPQDRANESVSYEVHAQRNIYNTANAGLAMTWNILCAFQVAYLYYLWFTGPIVAALWVYPMGQLRQAFGNWMAGVAAICFWSLFWNTVVLLMACLRGVDETGTMMATALNFLATASVKSAFDFAGLARSAGDQIGSIAKSSAAAAKGASGAGNKGQQGQKGGNQQPGAAPRPGAQPVPTGAGPGSRLGSTFGAPGVTPTAGPGSTPGGLTGDLRPGGALGGAFGQPIVPAGMHAVSPLNIAPPPLGGLTPLLSRGSLSFLDRVPSSEGGGIDHGGSLGLQAAFAGLPIQPLSTEAGGTPAGTGAGALPHLNESQMHSLMHSSNADGSLKAESRALAAEIAQAGGAVFNGTTIAAADMAAGNLPPSAANAMAAYDALSADSADVADNVALGDSVLLGDSVSLGDDVDNTFVDDTGLTSLSYPGTSVAPLIDGNSPPPTTSTLPTATTSSVYAQASPVPLTGVPVQVTAGTAGVIAASGTVSATTMAAAAASRGEAQQLAAVAQREAVVAAATAAATAQPAVTTTGGPGGNLLVGGGAAVLAKEAAEMAMIIGATPDVIPAATRTGDPVGSTLSTGIGAGYLAMAAAAISPDQPTIVSGLTMSPVPPLALAPDLKPMTGTPDLNISPGGTFARDVTGAIVAGYGEFNQKVAEAGAVGVTDQMRHAVDGTLSMAAASLESTVTGLPSAIAPATQTATSVPLAASALPQSTTPVVGAAVPSSTPTQLPGAATGMLAGGELLLAKETAEMAALFAPPTVKAADGSPMDTSNSLPSQGVYAYGTSAVGTGYALPAAPNGTQFSATGDPQGTLVSPLAAIPTVLAGSTMQPTEPVELAKAAPVAANAPDPSQTGTLVAGSNFMQSVNDRIVANYDQFNETVAGVGGTLARDQVRWSVDGIQGLAAAPLGAVINGMPALPAPAVSATASNGSIQPANAQLTEASTASGAILPGQPTPSARTEYSFANAAPPLVGQMPGQTLLPGAGAETVLGAGSALVRDQLNSLADAIGAPPEVLLAPDPAASQSGVSSGLDYLAKSSYELGTASGAYGYRSTTDVDAVSYDLTSVPLVGYGSELPGVSQSALGAVAGGSLLADNTGIVGERINDRYEAQQEQFLDDRAQLARQGVQDAVENSHSLAKASLESAVTGLPPTSADPLAVTPIPAASSALTQALNLAASPQHPSLPVPVVLETAQPSPPDPACFGVIARNRQDALSAVQGALPVLPGNDSKKIHSNDQGGQVDQTVSQPKPQGQSGSLPIAQAAAADGGKGASKLASALGRAATNPQSGTQPVFADPASSNSRPGGQDAAQPPLGSQVRSVNDPMGAVATGTTLRRWRQKPKANAEEIAAMQKLAPPESE